jgi:Reverse transcriptase (RNA-dependent DNA polymerase)
LYTTLKRHEELFDGFLGKWNMQDYEIKLQPDAKPYHAKAFPIPQAYMATLKMEVEQPCKVGVLRQVNQSEWEAPTFIIPKKDGSVQFISDFCKLNKRIKRKPYSIPKIQDMLLKLEGFQWATSLDLNMGYYHIKLSPFSKRLCTIVLPWGKYEYQRLPMGLCNSPDIFQEKMGTLTQDLEYVRAYVEDLLIITKGTFEDHIDKLEVVFNKLKQAGLKVNAKNSFFMKSELEYLGYWISKEGMSPTTKKVNAIANIATSTNKKECRHFIGMVHYY